MNASLEQPLADLLAPLAAPSWSGAVAVDDVARDPVAVALAAGAALAALHPLGLETVPGAPFALMRDRLALAAAEACAIRAGDRARAAEMRDAVHLRLPGDRPGPAGETLELWRRAVARRVEKGTHADLASDLCGRAAGWDAGLAALDPVTAAAAALERLLAHATRAERAAAAMLADATLSWRCGWPHLLPALGSGLRREDMGRTGEALRLACLRALAAQAPLTLTLAADLVRRAARLRAAAPSLRAKASGAAVRLLLSQDALAPSLALTQAAGGPAMSDRAARRLCDRLVALGAARELTGRATHRLYGL